jgi:hypothetical protein
MMQSEASVGANSAAVSRFDERQFISSLGKQPEGDSGGFQSVLTLLTLGGLEA